MKTAPLLDRLAAKAFSGWSMAPSRVVGQLTKEALIRLFDDIVQIIQAVLQFLEGNYKSLPSAWAFFPEKRPAKNSLA
jgi:hypothetical protein